MTQTPVHHDLSQFAWFNEPATWTLNQCLEIRTDPDTDFWQRTHYGFRRDNGHFFHIALNGDFRFAAHCEFFPTAQYDQCGLMVRVDADHWIKCSTEYETPELSRLGSVVTNGGYSDWATQDASSALNQTWYAFKREGQDFLLEWSLDGREWRQMRIAHLHHCPDAIAVGIYACSPTGNGFLCRVREVFVEPAG